MQITQHINIILCEQYDGLKYTTGKSWKPNSVKYVHHRHDENSVADYIC